MKLSVAASLLLSLSSHLAEAIGLRGEHECDSGYCLCRDECRALQEDHTCCPKNNGHPEHICGPGKECCAYGCCREGWKCGKNEMCYPPEKFSSVPTGCLTTVYTVTVPIPIYPTTDSEVSNTRTVRTTPTCTEGGSVTTGSGGVTTTLSGESTVIITTGTKTGESGLSSKTSRGQTDSEGNTHTTRSGHSGSSTNRDSSQGTSATGSLTSGQYTRTSATGQGSTKITTPIVSTKSNGQVTTIYPTNSAASHTSGHSSTGRTVPGIVTTNSDGQVTTIYQTGTEDLTSKSVTSLSSGDLPSNPTKSQTGVITTYSDGQVSTIFPPETITSATRSDRTSGGSNTVSSGGGQTGATSRTGTPIVTTRSDGQVITIIPTELPTSGQTGTPTSSRTPIVTTNSNGQVTTIVPTDAGSTGTGSTVNSGVPTSSSTAIIVTTNSDGQVTTIVPTDNGSTGSSGVPTSGSIPVIVTTNSDGQVTTISPTNPTNTGSSKSGESTRSTTPIVTTNSDGQVTTIIPTETNPTVTKVTSGLTAIITTNSDGQVTTIVPTDFKSTSSGLTPIVTTRSDGHVTTLTPTETKSGENSSTDSSGAVVPTDTPIVTTNSDGQVTTILPTKTQTTESSAGQSTVDHTSGSPTRSPTAGTGTNGTPTSTISSTKSTVKNGSSGVETSTGSTKGETSSETGSTSNPATVTTTPTSGSTATPTSGDATPTDTTRRETTGSEGSTTGIVTTKSDGQQTTPPPSTDKTTTPAPTTSETDDDDDYFIVPITTPVPKPRPGPKKGIEIPCSIWFFNACPPGWDDWKIGGWGIILPTGPVPPGPPPPLKIDPSLSITINTKGTLPPWPAYTIGPDRQPTFPPKPSGCKTETAEICVTRLSYGVSISSTVTSTTGSQTVSACGTVFGCNLEDVATTTTTTRKETATAEPRDYVVWPKDGRNESEVAVIEEEIYHLVNDSSNVYTSEIDGMGVLYWVIPITMDEAKKLFKFEGVASIYEQCGTDYNPCYDPTIELVYQENAKEHLGYIGWPDMKTRVSFKDLDNRYYFDDTSGEGVDVWIIDTGMTPTHPEFSHLKDKVDWTVPLADFDDVTRQDDSQSLKDLQNVGQTKAVAHGSGMLSLVAGRTLGVAKKVTPHIVRLPRISEQGGGGGWRPEQFVDVVHTAAKKMEAAANDAISGIVLMSIHYPRSEFYWRDKDNVVIYWDNTDDVIDGSMGFELALYRALGLMEQKGYLIVTGPDNKPGNRINGFPASYGSDKETLYLESLLVVGPVRPGEPRGAEESYKGQVDPEKGLPHVYAPGVEVIAANGDRNQWKRPAEQPQLPSEESYFDGKGAWVTNTGGFYKISTGASDAAALTAGLAANFLKLIRLGTLKTSDGSVVENSVTALKKFIIDKAWSRGAINGFDGLKERIGIYNGADLTKPACKFRLDAGSDSAPTPAPDARRRQDGEACEIPLGQSKTTTTVNPSDLFPTGFPTLFPSLTTTTSSAFSWPSDFTVPSFTDETTTKTTTTTEPKPTTTSTTEEPTETGYYAPLELGENVCNDPKDFEGHAEIRWDWVQGVVQDFCEDMSTGFKMQPGFNVMDALYTDVFDHQYEFDLYWLDDCYTDDDSQDPINPIKDDDWQCYDILWRAWDKCTGNEGVGGYIDAGCLRYRIDAGV